MSGEIEGEQSTLFKRFSSLSVTFDEEDFPDRYAWINAIEDAFLSAKLSKLSEQDLKLLTLYAIEGYTQAEIALLLKRNQSVISRKINRLKNFLKK